MIGWDALTSADAPLVGTFHCYSESSPAARRRGADGRAAQAQPAGRADRGLRRRRLDRPALLRRRATGSCRTASSCRTAARRPRACARAASRWRSCSSARPSSARACRCCCARSRRCAGTCPARLTIVGASEPEVAPLLVEREGVTVLGRVSDDEKRAALERADVLAAPSLGGESFGMVLTESLRGRHAGRRLRHRRLPRRGARRRRRRARAARRRDGAGRDAARARARPGADRRARDRRRRRRRALRVAEGRRRGRLRLRGRARGAGARGRRRARGRARSACAPPTSARAGRRGGCRRWSRRPRPRGAPAVLLRRGADRWSRRSAPIGGSYLAHGADRRRPGRAHARDVEPGVGRDRAGADVRLDGLPRGLLGARS